MAASSNRDRPAPLYRRLPHGPNGLPREKVAGNQRGRLLGAIVESIGERGYQATSVAHVIGLAGVSRRAFYEQFANKEACCLRAHDVIVAHARKHVLEAWAREGAWADCLSAACEALLDAAADSPKGARLVLIDSPAIGNAGRERMRLADYSFERLLAGALRVQPGVAPSLWLTPQAIVAGVRAVLLSRLSAGREHELHGLGDQLCAWVESYRPTTADAAAQRLDPPRAGAAAGAPGRAERRAHEREHAAAELDEILAGALAEAARALDCAESWPQGVCVAFAAFLGAVGAHEELLHRVRIDQLAEDPAGRGPMAVAIAALLGALQETAPPLQAGPDVAREAIAGALSAIADSRPGEVGAGSAAELHERVCFIVLCPYVGADLALETLCASAPLAPRR